MDLLRRLVTQQIMSLIDAVKMATVVHTLTIDKKDFPSDTCYICVRFNALHP